MFTAAGIYCLLSCLVVVRGQFFNQFLYSGKSPFITKNTNKSVAQSKSLTVFMRQELSEVDDYDVDADANRMTYNDKTRIITFGKNMSNFIDQTNLGNELLNLLRGDLVEESKKWKEMGTVEEAQSKFKDDDDMADWLAKRKSLQANLADLLGTVDLLEKANTKRELENKKQAAAAAADVQRNQLSQQSHQPTQNASKQKGRINLSVKISKQGVNISTHVLHRNSKHSSVKSPTKLSNSHQKVQNNKNSKSSNGAAAGKGTNNNKQNHQKQQPHPSNNNRTNLKQVFQGGALTSSSKNQKLNLGQISKRNQKINNSGLSAGPNNNNKQLGKGQPLRQGQQNSLGLPGQQSKISLKMNGLNKAAKWSYDDNEEVGPSKWKFYYDHCGGTRQSPIVINSGTTLPLNFKEFVFTNFDVPPVNVSVQNVGHTVQLTRTYASDQKTVMLVGANLDGTYGLRQVHFHWGSNISQGSEHIIDGKQYPCEMHMIFRNFKYSSTEEASLFPDGFSILAFFLDMDSKDNPELELFFKALDRIQTPNSKSFIPRAVQMDRVMAGSMNGTFFRYRGSLTSPGCQEAVTWTVFQKPISISQKQLKKLRRLQGENQKSLTDNFRPSQPHNGRTVYRNAGPGRMIMPSISANTNMFGGSRSARLANVLTSL